MCEKVHCYLIVLIQLITRLQSAHDHNIRRLFIANSEIIVTKVKPDRLQMGLIRFIEFFTFQMDPENWFFYDGSL